MTHPRNYDTERNRMILRERHKGRTYKSIGLEFGLSVERVRQVCVILRRQLATATTPPPLPHSKTEE
jgi:DNA-directed RNA polymerase sigma subunit (sigma70/sigma32)